MECIRNFKRFLERIAEVFQKSGNEEEKDSSSCKKQRSPKKSEPKEKKKYIRKIPKGPWEICKFWKKGIVPYVLHPSVENMSVMIRSAMDHIEEKTSVRFVQRQQERDYVKIKSGKMSFSLLGRRIGKQPLKLTSNAHIGVALHELLHTLGFNHEHQRQDRDEYIKINYRNISSENFSQYGITFEYSEKMPGDEFDPMSVMMYPNYPGSMESKSELIQLQSQLPDQLSTLDIKRIQFFYGPDSKSKGWTAYRINYSV